MNDTFISSTHYVGSVPGQITSSGKIAGLGPKGTVWIDKGQQADGTWLYWRQGYTPEQPPVELPTINTKIAFNADGEVFIQNEGLTVGYNVDGGLGTVRGGPSDIRSDIAGGFARVGFYPKDKKDIILPGRTIEGFALSYNNTFKANMKLTGFSQIPGKLSTKDGSWEGRTSDGVAIKQTVELKDNFLKYDVTLTNYNDAGLANLRYMRAADVDEGENFLTTNVVDPIGVVTSKVGSGDSFVLGSDDPRAFAAYGGFVTADPRQIKKGVVGASKKADATTQLVFELGRLETGQSVTVSFFEKFVPKG